MPPGRFRNSSFGFRCGVNYHQTQDIYRALPTQKPLVCGCSYIKALTKWLHYVLTNYFSMFCRGVKVFDDDFVKSSSIIVNILSQTLAVIVDRVYLYCHKRYINKCKL